MAYYAFLNDDNVVTEVIAGVPENETIEGLSPEEWYTNFRGQRCVRTSYNGSIRKNYAGVGFYFDDALDAFIPPKLFPSWELNPITYQWDAPIPRPIDDSPYYWDEASMSWVALAAIKGSN
jgi:hypothetical protein